MDDRQERELLKALAKERPGRRAFMQRAALLGVGGVAAANLWTGSARAAEPRHGGHLRLGIAAGSTTDSLDPGVYDDSFDLAMGWSFANNLTVIDKYGKLAPELAESWEPSADATTWTFKLRKGVEFHNGKTLTADDVVTSINHHRGPDSKSGAAGILKSIVDIEKDDDRTVVFTLSDGSADFPFLLSDYHLIVFPDRDGQMYWEDGIGTGPFVLENFEPGIRVEMTKNKNYWKEGRPYFDDYSVLAILDPSARVNALQTGEVDAIERVDVKIVERLARVAGIDILENTGYLHYTFPMRCDTAPFDDNDVRLAMKYALDREELMRKIVRGHGTLGNDSPIGPNDPFYDPNLPKHSYDPDKAKFHLKKAGMENLKVDLATADGAYVGAVDASVLYAEQAKKAGIEINVERVSSDGYWASIWMNRPFCACYWGGRPTADWMFSTAYAADAAWNDTFWKNERFNELLIKARSELDQDLRREMYSEMQQIVSADGGAIVWAFANNIMGISDKVQHEETVASNYSMDGFRASQRWWMV
ncbi:MAG: ABC transporter substrate-binding protein [Rhodospirillales bacterium]|nr:ABC transporter substrate-binding protein [Rhodospirillales bacterium]